MLRSHSYVLLLLCLSLVPGGYRYSYALEPADARECQGEPDEGFQGAGAARSLAQAPSAITLRLVVSQDPAIISLLYDPAHGDMGITPEMLQYGIMITYFAADTASSAISLLNNDINDINCTVGFRTDRVWIGGTCDVALSASASPAALLDRFSAGTRQLYTNAGIVCRSNITWTVVPDLQPQVIYSCTPGPNISSIVTYQAQWLCCVFAPNAPAPEPPSYPGAQSGGGVLNPVVPDDPAYAPDPPYFPLEPPNQPPAGKRKPPRPPHPPGLPFTPQFPQWPPGTPGDQPMWPMTALTGHTPATPPVEELAPIRVAAGCMMSTLGYACARDLGGAIMHWYWGLDTPNNPCTSVYGSSLSASAGSLHVHFAIEAVSRPEDNGAAPGYVALSFAAMAGQMAPALAVIGVVDPATGQSGIQYQELTSQQPGRPSAQLQAAVAYAGTWQRGGRTVLCLAVPLAAVAPPRQGSRRRMLQSDQPLRWLPPDVYLDIDYNWAVGPPSSPANTAWLTGQPLPKHVAAGGLTFNLLTGQARKRLPEPYLPLLVTHACFLAAAFLVFFPLSALTARHRHVFFSSAKPRVPTDPAHHAPHDNNQTAQDLTKLKDGPLIAQDIDTPDPPATESFRVGSGHDQSPNRSHSHSSHAGPVAESDEGTHSGSDDGLQSAAHSEAGMDAEQGKVVPIGHGGRMEVAGAAPDRASQRTSAGASTSRSSPLLTARIVAGIPLGHAAKQGSDTPTNNVNTNTNAHTLDSPDNGAQGHTNAATTGTDTQGHSPHMGTGLMWSEYRVFQMPSWLRRHVLFNWLAIVAYVVAFALGVVWLRKGPDVQCPRGLLVAWGVLSLVILAQIIIQAITPLLGLHLREPGPVPRPSIHQWLGRLVLLTGWVYGAITSYLIVDAPGQRRIMAICCVAVPFAGFVLIFILVDFKLRHMHGSPMRAHANAWFAFWASLLHSDFDDAPTLDDLQAIHSTDEESMTEARVRSGPTTPSTFIDTAAVPGLVPSSRTHSMGPVMRRSVGNGDAGGGGGGGAAGYSARGGDMGPAAAVMTAGGTLPPRGSPAGSRPGSAASRGTATPRSAMDLSSESIRRTPHLDSNVIQDGSDGGGVPGQAMGLLADHPSRTSPKQSLAVVVPGTDANIDERPSLGRAGSLKASRSGRLEALPPIGTVAGRQTLPPLSLSSGALRRKPLALKPLTHPVGAAPDAGSSNLPSASQGASLFGSASSPAADDSVAQGLAHAEPTAGPIRLGKHQSKKITLSKQDSLGTAPRMFSRHKSLNVRNLASDAFLPAGGDEPGELEVTRPSRDRSSLPIAWGEDRCSQASTSSATHHDAGWQITTDRATQESIGQQQAQQALRAKVMSPGREFEAGGLGDPDRPSTERRSAWSDNTRTSAASSRLSLTARLPAAIDWGVPQETDEPLRR